MLWLCGALGRIRACSLRLRRPLRCPVALQGRVVLGPATALAGRWCGIFGICATVWRRNAAASNLSVAIIMMV